MAYRIMHNKENHSVTLFFSSTTTGIVIVGNTSSSNIAIGAETIQAAGIRQLWYGGETNSQWRIDRGSNTLVYVLCQASNYLDFSGAGCMQDLDSTGTLSCTLTGGANAYLMVELRKLNPSTKYQ